MAPRRPVASSISPIGDSAVTASWVTFAPTSAPRLAPSMITTNRRWPLFTLKESAANAHICDTTISP